MAEQQENGQSISAGMANYQNLTQHLLTLPDEIALYDRQIRLWGVHAQEK
jgi:ubiquitin-like 1-activating enzyme E1 A